MVGAVPNNDCTAGVTTPNFMVGAVPNTDCAAGLTMPASVLPNTGVVLGASGIVGVGVGKVSWRRACHHTSIRSFGGNGRARVSTTYKPSIHRVGSN